MNLMKVIVVRVALAIPVYRHKKNQSGRRSNGSGASNRQGI